MPVQWFFVPFVRKDTGSRHGRYCKVADFQAQIDADAGDWANFECGGGPGTSFVLGVAGCKVRASQATLDALTADQAIRAIPATLTSLDTSLSVLTNPQRLFLRDTLAPAIGYSTAEVNAWLGAQTINQKTYGQLLDFLATRWYSPVWDSTIGPQTGYQGVSYPGFLAADGRTVGGTQPGTSTQMTPAPVSPAQVDASVANA